MVLGLYLHEINDYEKGRPYLGRNGCGENGEDHHPQAELGKMYVFHLWQIFEFKTDLYIKPVGNLQDYRPVLGGHAFR